MTIYLLLVKMFIRFYTVLQNIYMDERVLGTLGIKLQIYRYCIGRQEN
jgi:hypothetical protein